MLPQGVHSYLARTIVSCHLIPCTLPCKLLEAALLMMIAHSHCSHIDSLDQAGLAVSFDDRNCALCLFMLDCMLVSRPDLVSAACLHVVQMACLLQQT